MAAYDHDCSLQLYKFLIAPCFVKQLVFCRGISLKIVAQPKFATLGFGDEYKCFGGDEVNSQHNIYNATVAQEAKINTLLDSILT